MDSAIPRWTTAFGWTLTGLVAGVALLVFSKMIACDAVVAQQTVAPPTTPATTVLFLPVPVPVPTSQPTPSMSQAQTVIFDASATRRNQNYRAMPTWRDAYLELEMEVIDNCTRNPQLKACQKPAHLRALERRQFFQP